MKHLLAFLLGCIALDTTLHAQTRTTSEYQFSATISPIQLIYPVVRFDLEYRTGDDHGIGVHGQAGSFESDAMFGLGAQFSYYAVGNFQQGVQVAGMLQYIHVTDSSNSIAGRGVGFCALVGYKYTAPFGLTGFVNGGPGIQFKGATAKSGIESGLANALGVFAYLNLGIGWSF